MAVVMFRGVNPSSHYLVIRQGRSGPFITDRLMKGLAVNLVGHRDSEVGHPIRDLGIYRVSESGEGHNEIAEGWVGFLVEQEIAVLKDGSDLTVEDIRACATMHAIAFLEQEGDDSGDSTAP